MPVLLDMPGLFLAGSAVALVSRRRIANDRVRGFSRHVKSALAFALLYGLVAAVLAFWREDWMWSYVLKPPLPTVVWYGLYCGAALGVALAGAGLTQRALRASRTRRALLYFGSSAALLALVWVATVREYTHFGSYAEFHEGLAFPIDLMPDTASLIIYSGAIDGALLAMILAINVGLDRRAARRRAKPDASRGARLAESDVVLAAPLS